MDESRRVAVVGLGAIMPDAPDAPAFWENIQSGKYSISEVPPSRWDPELYYDPDPGAPDKTYSKIGGWVRTFGWDPLGWKLPIPPKVSEAMDDGQKWAIACTRAALADYGYPERPLEQERTAVIIGNALSGELHYATALRIYFPEFAEQLSKASSFVALPEDVRAEILSEFLAGARGRFPRITEDTMPGELGNVLAGRVSALFNLRGPNYITDAACGSALAAMSAAVRGLADGEYDAVVTGGIDRNMGAVGFVKFSKIGALSATGTRPYAEGADGFVMGEGGALFLLKRLADAERDGDRIYAVIRSFAGSSDGKGRGITAPNPIGQRLVLERAWRAAGESPASVTLIEGHGTSTQVGDVVEVGALGEFLAGAGAAPGSIALGSVKSNLGHLKAAAGAAGMLKTILALHHKVLPPSLNFDRPNPDIDFANSPLAVNTRVRPWEIRPGQVRRAGVSAFGFGGTNWHAVVDEYVPGQADGGRKVFAASSTQVLGLQSAPAVASGSGERATGPTAPLRGITLLGGSSSSDLVGRLEVVKREAEAGTAPITAAPSPNDLAAPERICIDFADAADLAAKAGRALQALSADEPAVWKALRGQGIFRGHGAPGKVAFLYTGQGSQYANMLRGLAARVPLVADVFARADRVMTVLLGRPLTDYLFVDGDDPAAMAAAEAHLMQTEITQPAVLAVDLALTELLAAYGIHPDMVMGHSLGEYGALMAAGALSFEHALEAVSARGKEMASLTIDDNGRMAAVFAPMQEIERILASIDGYVVMANLNSSTQAVIGGASDPVDRAVQAFLDAGYRAIPLPVSHAFHTSIVAPASEPLRQTLVRLDLRPPKLPIVANVDGEFYPTGDGVRDQMLDILAAQVASPVQFVKGLNTLYDAGARVFVEVGPKRALQGFVDDVLADRPDVASLFTNHPKVGDVASFNQALCGLYAEGLTAPAETERPVEVRGVESLSSQPSAEIATATTNANGGSLDSVFTEFLGRVREMYAHRADGPAEKERRPVVISGAALGLPGTERIFDDLNVGRILRGDQLIDSIPVGIRNAMLDKNITRLVKRENGDPTFETITDPDEVIKLAGRGGALDLEEEFGVSAERIPALDRATKLAIGAGIDALRDAGLPLVARYRTTSKGTKLPDGWSLPEAIRDDTGVIFASAFPGYDAFADELKRYYEDRARRDRLHDLQSLRERMSDGSVDATIAAEVDRRIDELHGEIERNPYVFDRRFLFKALPMGHAQFAEIIGARGPNTQINSACASTTQAIGLAEDWIREGRCRRVILIAGDDATSDRLLEWIGAGFLASGAAATDAVVENAATPFDRRRHGLLIGMGAAGLVVESAEAAAERGIRPICEVLGAATANSAFHGSRLDVHHIAGVMESLVSRAERTWAIRREDIAPEMVFVSHETYTPARGGSAAAEVEALRSVFGAATDRIVVANTKGFTGHPMGVGIEDVVAVKSLETGVVPPVPNYREVDPDLGTLNLSKGGAYPVRFALRLAAGFGSQISMTLLRWVPSPDGSRRAPDRLGYDYRIADPEAWAAWLSDVTGLAEPDVEVVQRRLRVSESQALRPGLSDEQPAHAPADPVRAEASTVTPQPVVNPGPVITPEPVVASEPALAPAVVMSPAEVMPLAETAPHSAAASEEPAPAGQSIEAAVLALVAGKTGYPEDMLDLDLDLEADLGVDTVKQAEIFATLRESYGIPRDETLKLRDFPSLQHVIGFVRDRATVATGATTSRNETGPDAAPEAESANREVDRSPEAAPPSDESGVRDAVLALVAGKTGYPEDMLDLDLDLEADLGVDTVKQAEIFATLRESYGIPRDETLKLRDFPSLQHVIGFVLDRSAPRRERADSPVAGSDQPAIEGPAIGEAEPVDPQIDAAATTDAQTETMPALDEGDVRDAVLALVAGKTGYPEDMLDLDLDLEADLGVDTVKQAEIFATLRESYGIPRDEALKLREFPTLQHVIGFVVERAAKPSSAAPDVVGPANVEMPLDNRTTAGLEAADSVPGRIPVPVLRPSLDLCKPTGVTIGPGSHIVVMADAGGVAKALAIELETSGASVLFVEDRPEGDDLVSRLHDWLGDEGRAGIYWLPALDRDPPIGDLDLSGWREELRVRLKLLFATAQTLNDRVSFLVTATRLGGLHGYEPEGALGVMGGAVTGFTKAFAREYPEAAVKAVDFEDDAPPEEIARTLIEEALADPGAVEIGRRNGLRWAVGLEDRALSERSPQMTIGPDTVFVVTGAAGGIVSAIVADLAGASGGTFHLLDLAPEPDPQDPDLQWFATDREGLKREIAARMKSAGERPTPALVERQLGVLERADAAVSAIRAIESSGGRARYHQVDLTDGEAVARVVEAIREQDGRIDVLLHAAGLEISHLLADKPAREFDLVFGVKADGWFNLLHAISDMPLGATVVFSSVAGRFGNGGQTDYSSANDLLCKATSNLRRTRPDTRAIAIDWTAWAGIGMASRGSIPKVMEAAGIDMLPAQAGIPVIRRELVMGTTGEVVIGGRLGILTAERDEQGGLDPAMAPSRAPMAERISGMGVYEGLLVETTLDPTDQPFLDHHRIDGTPVLPGVMGIEAFAEAASVALPGWNVTAVEDVDFLAPFKFYRDGPRTLMIRLQFRPEGDEVVAACRLLGSRSLPNQDEPHVTTHFTGTVRLSRTPPTGESATVPAAGSTKEVDREAIYRIYFHGPAYQVLQSVRPGRPSVGVMAADLPPNNTPSDAPSLVAPRLIELCFQTAGMWELSTLGRFALPLHVDRVRPAAEAGQAEGPFFAVVMPAEDGNRFDASVVDARGNVHLSMEGYRTVALPGAVDAEALALVRT